MSSKRRPGRAPRLSPVLVWPWLLLLTPLMLVPPHADGGPASVVSVEMVEFAFHPAVIRLSAGRPVTLVLENRGQLSHQFETGYLRTVPTVVVTDALRVEASGVTVVRLQPGATAKVTFVPAIRGRVSFACTIEGHREAGMAGTLEIR